MWEITRLAFGRLQGRCPNSQSTESIPNQYSNDTTHHLPNLAAMVGATSTRRLVGVRVRVRVGVRASASASARARAKIKVRLGPEVAPSHRTGSSCPCRTWSSCASWSAQRGPGRRCGVARKAGRGARGAAWRVRRGSGCVRGGSRAGAGARGEAHRANLAGLPYLGRLARHPRRLPSISTRRSARAAGGARVTAARSTERHLDPSLNPAPSPSASGLSPRAVCS